MTGGKLFSILVAFIAVLVLTACTGGGDSLDGTSWKLESLNGQGLIDGTEITITFENGEIDGVGGCNNYGGGYESSGSDLSFGMMFMTEMACMDPEGVMQQESEYMVRLGTASSYSITGDRLEIFDGSGAAILVFVVAD